MKPSETSLISIIIPTYNRLPLLKETLESVFSQINHHPVEVIVVDDGSEDGTWEYLKELSNKYSFLKIFRHPQNLGVSSARNSGLKLAKGKYVFFLDSDDLLLPRSLEKLIYLSQNNSYEVYLTNSFREKKGKKKFKPFPEVENPFMRLKFFLEGAYSEGLFLVKREVALLYPFPEDLKVREDFVIKAKWLTLHKVKIINEPFGLYRDHPNRLRYNVNFYLDKALSSVDYLFRDLPSIFQSLYPYALFLTYYELAKKAYLNKNYSLSLTYLIKAKKNYPKGIISFKFLKLWIKSFIKLKGNYIFTNLKSF
ncbi:MAG: glycosyltransferase family 2 protein [Caldimicrobium sp.]